MAQQNHALEKMDPYRCSFCPGGVAFINFSSVLEHTVAVHGNENLSIKKLDLKSGKYKKKIYPSVGKPDNVMKNGFVICSSNEDEKVNISKPDEYAIKEPEEKKRKIESTHYQQSDKQHESEIPHVGKYDSEIQFLLKLLPTCFELLESAGILKSWLRFHELVCEKTFSLNNIAFLLFIDVVRFLDCETTTTMRYNENVKNFWFAGYKLFHGKFLRFMGGTKNRGQLLSTDATPGYYSPLDAEINFAVPDSRALTSEELLKGNTDPGILDDVVSLMADSYQGKSMKLCFDGKRINGSLSEKFGDVDLFGCEPSPTLNEVREKTEDDMNLVSRIAARVDSLDMVDGENDEEVICDIQSLIKALSFRLKALREMSVIKQAGIKKFKAMGQPDRRKSKYMYVVSSLQSSLYRIKECVEALLQTNNHLGRICASLQNKAHAYKMVNTMQLNEQCNYICLADKGTDVVLNLTPDLDRHVVKQTTGMWREVRHSAMATGSTAFRAVGLGKLKEQVEHFDRVVCGKAPKPVSADAQERMDHGKLNEINAKATLLTKVLPVYYPQLKYVEEGCFVLKNNGKDFFVVSPDGSCRESSHSNSKVALEFKCPFPGKEYTTDVMYKIPVYYSIQLLSEMKVLQCQEMIFLSYTKESTTAFRVTFCQETWDQVWKELVCLYGMDVPKRPTRKSRSTDSLRETLIHFLKEKVSFLAEFPSVQGIECDHGAESAEIFNEHESDGGVDIDRNPSPWLFKARTCIKEASELCRRRATEVFAFLLSDLDRAHVGGLPHSMPIAYGLQGPSLNRETVRKMTEKVFDACNKKGIDLKVFACDGQWMGLVNHGLDGKPLTLLQKQKDHWETTQKMSKVAILKFMEKLHMICGEDGEINMGEITIERNGTMIDVSLIEKHHVFQMKTRHIHALKKPVKEKEKESDSDPGMSIISLLPADLQDKLDASTYDEVVRVVQTLASEQRESATDIRDDEADEEEGNDVEGSTSSDQKIVLEDAHLRCILSALSTDSRVSNQRKWEEMQCTDMCEYLSSFGAKSFSLAELKTCMRVLKQQFPEKTHGVRLSWSKLKLVNSMMDLLGVHGKHLEAPAKRAKCLSLKDLATAKVKKYPKHLLNIIHAELTFPDVAKEWKDSFVFSNTSQLNESQMVSWFSFPDSRKSANGCEKPIFGVIDSHHILTNLRTKVCTTGIIKCGIKRDAWVRVAKESRSNGCGLSLAHVDDIIDKQNNSYAKKTFSVEVENEMRKHGDHAEADFCRKVRLWYEADDEPGVDVLDRIRHRLSLRDWLLSMYNPTVFPPPTGYVRGIPIVTYEALLTSTERKIQMFATVPGNSYNARSVTTLDAENFFSVLQDLIPAGGSAIRPEHLHQGMKTACELLVLRLNPNKTFSMDTSRAAVYPLHALSGETCKNAEIGDASMTSNDRGVRDPFHSSDLSQIYTRNHFFDTEERRRRRSKRKSAEISAPWKASRGAQGVRQHHRTDESKIMPHVRLGIEVT